MKQEDEMPENKTVCPSIPVDLETYMDLDALYRKAVKNGAVRDTAVTYEGHELMVTYLYYLLEHMEMVSPKIRQHLESTLKKKPKRERIAQ